MATTFWDFHQHDPRLDIDGKSARLLQLQYSGYRRLDPPEKQQKAAPAILLQEVAKNSTTQRAIAIGELVVLAFFFAMRSCKYSKVAKQEEKRTKIIIIGGIWFFLNGVFIKQTHPDLHNADFVSVTFKDQKNAQKMETVTQFRTGDAVLCPVRACAALVR